MVKINKEYIPTYFDNESFTDLQMKKRIESNIKNNKYNPCLRCSNKKTGFCYCRIGTKL